MKYLLVFFFLISSFPCRDAFSAEVIWQTKNAWNESWEEKFGQWISASVDDDFFSKNNIETDCADAMVGLRWIFARNNSLPAANMIEGSNDLFGNFSMKKDWRNLPTSSDWKQDKLFLKALRYVMDETSTRSIDGDGYPVKLTREGLHPGTYIITKADDSRHTRIITSSDFSTPAVLPFLTKSSTTPAALRNLFQEILIDQEWPSPEKKIILSFRWPVRSGSKWVLLSPEKHPQYSREQFDPALEHENPSFIKFLIDRTKSDFDPINLIELGINDIKKSLQLRILIVDEGYKYCIDYDCHQGSKGFDDWSTYERDSKIVHKFNDFKNLMDQYVNEHPELEKEWTEALVNNKITVLNKEITLFDIRELFINKKVSSYPLDTPELRWGL
ncbi:MAG: hypothetical protein H7177_16090 [Rhizobacter sp.]|nr:hypothetical protein [Bacteriovorax sp.]